MADAQPPPPLPLSIASTVAVAAVAGAMGFGIVYWMTAEPGLRQQDAQPQAASTHSGDGEAAATGSRQQKLGWLRGWPWLLRSRSREAAAAAIAAERLSALARTNEAIERGGQLAQVPLASLGHAAPTPGGGGGGTGAASSKLFTDADLPSLKMCHKRNGSRMVLGGGTAGQVFKALRGGVHAIAVREFRYELSDEEQRQLLRLVSKLTRCGDSHVVKLLGFARIPGPGSGFYIASNLFERGSLKDALAGSRSAELLWYKRQKQGEPNSKKEQGAGQHIALAVARGLHWLHTNGIVHHDIRPSKVLLGEGRDIKLADAGLATFMKHDYMAAKSNLGPFIYTAPEIMHGIPGSASPPADIYSLGVLLWQLCTGADPAMTRKRMLEGGQHCPQAVADLIVQCLDRNPDARPTAGEVVALLSRREAQLPPALQPRASSRPPSGVPMPGGLQTVWDAITEWVYTCYGNGTTPSKEDAHAAGYVESPVERILEAREWDAYGKMIEVLRHSLAQEDVEVSGSEAFDVLVNMHVMYGWAVNTKLSMTCEAVREKRFSEMESLDSLLALVPEGYDKKQAAAEAVAEEGTRRDSQRSRRSSSKVPSPATSAATSAEAAAAKAASERTSDHEDLASDGGARPPNIIERLGLTQEQVDAILREREDFMRLNRRLVAERAALVRTLHDYAVGRLADHDAALAASRDLRTNVMVEGRTLWSMHIHVIWEVLSPWQYARMDTDAYPALTDPAALLREVAAAVGGTRTGSTDDAFTWQGIIHEGHWGTLRCDDSLIIR